MEVEVLLIEDRQLRFEDSILPHQHLIHMLLFVLCRVSRYFEDIVKFRIFRLRTIYNFFQVCLVGLYHPNWYYSMVLISPVWY